MPLYEYQCSSCGHRFEKIVKFSDAPIRQCPQCGKDTAEQMISAPAAHFKGEGWYVTDYARKKSAPLSSSSSDKKVDASASTDSKLESKPESKSESTTSLSKSDSSSSSSSSDTKKS